MPDLRQRIKDNAAKRLILPPDSHPSKEISRYKNFLKVETHRLKILHRGGEGGRSICQARAVVLDVLIQHLVRAVLPDQPRNEAGAPVALALVALGGYGRGELNPCSDLDIMFLHDGKCVSGGKPNVCLDALMNGVLYPLWDIGLKVGHSVRSISECVKIANTDMQSKTSLIEARLIQGHPGLFQEMRKTVEARCVRGMEDEYIASRLADQDARRAKFGNSACMQEPNIKNGCGGLRDFQNLIWMAYFKYRVRSLADLEARGQLSGQERVQLEEAYDFLLRVRTELHYLVGRPTDTLTKNVQPTVANNLRFNDRSIIRRLEAFMRVLYTHSRDIYLITRTLEQRLALKSSPMPRLSLRRLFGRDTSSMPPVLHDGFLFRNGEIHPGSSEVFREQPRRLMRVFLYAQQRELRLNPDLAQLMRNELQWVTREFLYDSHVRETFLEILDQRGDVSTVLRPMHETGLLGRYLPEFGRLTCLVQHEFYHRYTADEHTLVCLEKLDQVWNASAPPYQHFSELFKKIEHSAVLYLSLLLHDSGRATRDRRHTDGSLRMAQRIAKRLNLDPVNSQILRFLIENHLSMIQISQRRDLEDPNVTRKFAEQVRNPENLRLLMLHTFADSMGTGEEVWTDFKESLLWTLYDRTLHWLEGTADLGREHEKQRNLLANSVRKMLPRFVGEDELESHFSNLPPRYFQVHSAQEVLADLILVNRFMQVQCALDRNGLEPVTAWQDEPDRGYAAVSICTWDRPGLFSQFAGTLTAADMNIHSAKIFSRTDGLIIDSFFVTDARTGALPGIEAREKFDQLLRRIVAGAAELGPLLESLKQKQEAQSAPESEMLPPQIRFDNA
ncbi:MAG TPA: [protein-PII] uridylyltransferase, partial [Verrucomicrobiota bacterium]|nr:[protein-PII] uridylyltransferase [Verrucomicrobiota bacterium]